MPADTPSAASASELTPFFWIAGFAMCFALHLLLHPQSRIFRDALRWLGQHPAPLLWLMASLMINRACLLRDGFACNNEGIISAATGWPDVFLSCFAAGWKRLALVFHQA